MKLPRNELSNLVPEHTMGALERYIFNGLEPGGFLTAVIEGDLYDAIARADHYNQKALADIVKYIYNYCPAGSFGSKRAFGEWLHDDDECRTNYVNYMERHLTVVK